MAVFAFIRIWHFLDENSLHIDEVCINDITKKAGLSYCGGIAGLKVLDDLGLINFKKNGRDVNVVLTQKFFSTRKLFGELYKALVPNFSSNTRTLMKNKEGKTK